MKVSRRQALVAAGVGAAGAALLALPAARALAAAERLIPQKAAARVIVDNDFAGDPDGLVALAHQLLSPRSHVVLVTSSPLNPQMVEPHKKGRSAQAGLEIAQELIRRAAIASPPPVVAGPENFDGEPGAAARAIVAEAMRIDARPLFVTCGGPLTNVAAALRLEPAIAARMTVIWIGGGGYPAGGWEYNLATDVPAARQVIEQSGVPVWQIPQPAYRQLQYSVAEMAAEMRPISPFTRWLYSQFTTPPDFVEIGGTWPMGDSPLVLLTAISGESSRFADLTARRINDDSSYGGEIAGRTIRVYDQIDTRLTMADFIAKLRLHADPS